VAKAKQKKQAKPAKRSRTVARPAKRAAKSAKTVKKAAKKAAKKAPKGKAAKAPTQRAYARKTAADDGGKPKLRPIGEPVIPPPDTSSARNFGLRGAAPWVARHAAKHAEELRKRNAEPPPPGSARATLRVPVEAERIKSKVAELHQAMSKVRSLRKRFEKTFYEVGEVLAEVQRKQLYEAKGYSSFEAFLDREVELPRGVSLRLVRIIQTFHRDTAYDFGLDRLTTALAALDGELVQAPPSHPSSRGFSSAALPPRPPLRFDD
jgi:hypothetical protein